MLSVTEPTDTRAARVRAGALYNSSRQLDSITPTRESFVRDGFKVGFSTLYFPSTCVQTLPKHLLQLSHCGPKGPCRSEDAAGFEKVKRLRALIQEQVITWTDRDLSSLNQKPNHHTSTGAFCLELDWAQPRARQTSYFGCAQMRAGGLSSSSTFTELISVDGYERRQVIEANASLSLAAVPQTCHRSTAAAAASSHSLTRTRCSRHHPNMSQTAKRRNCEWRRWGWAVEAVTFKPSVHAVWIQREDSPVQR